jgi:hypothetical protein
MKRYHQLVETGRLRADSHQKGQYLGRSLKEPLKETPKESPETKPFASQELMVAVVGVLQKLYTDLLDYKPKEILASKVQNASGSPVYPPIPRLQQNLLPRRLPISSHLLYVLCI